MNKEQTGLILRQEYRIPAYYVSLNGQIKFYTLASMFIESAAAHADMYGFGYKDMKREKVYWVLSRFQVIIHAYPRMNEQVIIQTWPKGADRLFFLRDYNMFSQDSRLLASATTAWLILDGRTGRPQQMDAAGNLENYHVDNLHAIEKVPGKLPSVTDPDRQVKVIARYSDLDINRHVNAIKYIEWIQDCYAEIIYQKQNVREFQINYQLETRFGEEVEIRIKKLGDGDPYEYFEGIRKKDGNPAFRARIRFEEIK